MDFRDLVCEVGKAAGCELYQSFNCLYFPCPVPVFNNIPIYYWNTSV